MINSKIINIVKVMKKEPEYISSAEIALLTGYSKKTIVREITRFNSVKPVEKHGFFIGSKKSKGFQIVVEDSKKYYEIINEHLTNSNTKPIDFDNQLRERTILSNLLLLKQEVHISQIAKEFNVSESTVKQDLRRVRKTLSNYGLALTPMKKGVLTLEGDESVFRYLMLKQSIKYNYTFVEIVEYNTRYKEYDIIATNAVRKVLKKHGANMSAFQSKAFLKMLFISEYRSYYGKSVIISEKDKRWIKENEAYKLVSDIYNEIYSNEMIQKKFKPTYNEEEVIYLSLFLFVRNDDFLYEEENKFSLIAEDFFESSESNFSIDFKRYGYEKEVHTYLNKLYFKLKYNVQNVGEMNYELLEYGLLSKEIAVVVKQRIEQESCYMMYEEELNYFANYLLTYINKIMQDKKKKNIVLETRYGQLEEKLIRQELEKEFGEKIGDVARYFVSNTDEDFKDYDAMISTYRKREKRIIPTFYIDEIADIKNHYRLQYFFKHEVMEKVLINLFEEEYYYKSNQNFKTQEEILSYMIQTMNQYVDTPEDYLKEIMERESIVSTSNRCFFAFTHPFSLLAKESFISVMELSRLFQWDEQKVKFVVLINISEQDKEYIPSVFEIIRKLSDPKVVRDFVEMPSYQLLWDTIMEN